MSFFDNVSRKVKQKAEEWDVQGKAEKLAAEVEKAAGEAKDRAAEYADDNRDRIRDGLDKAGAKIDERTEGKYSDKIAQATGKVTEGVDRLAEQRPGGPTPPGETPTTAPTAPPAAPPTTGYAAGAATPYTPEPYVPDPIAPPEPIDESAPARHQGTGWPQDAPPRP